MAGAAPGNAGGRGGDESRPRGHCRGRDYRRRRRALRRELREQAEPDRDRRRQGATRGGDRGLARKRRGVAAIGLAKQREEVFVPGRSAPLTLPSDDPASLLLQRIRDEAHRFAVTFHRQRRGGDLRRASIFDELPKVGPVRRRAILTHFGSPERFIAASRDEIEQVPGLPRRVAARSTRTCTRRAKNGRDAGVAAVRPRSRVAEVCGDERGSRRPLGPCRRQGPTTER